MAASPAAVSLSHSEQAKRRLILAAMRLFAEYGVDSVSLRMINREAGSKNNSALHYHFGSKLGLIEAVDQFIQQHFDEMREPAISDLESRAAAGDASLQDIMQVFTDAYVGIIVSYDWGYDAVRTIARMEFDANDEVHKLLSKSAGHSVKRFAKLARPLLPDLTSKQFKQRYNFVMNSIINGFASYRNLDATYLGDLSIKDLKGLASFFTATATAILTAPN